MATQVATRMISDRESAIVQRITKIFSELTTYRNVFAGQWEEGAILADPDSAIRFSTAATISRA